MLDTKYSLFNMIKVFNENKNEIIESIKGSSLEGYDDDDHDSGKYLGLTVGVFMVLLLISLVIWVLALYLTLTRWNHLENWAKIIALVGLFTGFGGPLLTIVVVYLGQKN